MIISYTGVWIFLVVAGIHSCLLVFEQCLFDLLARFRQALLFLFVLIFVTIHSRCTGLSARLFGERNKTVRHKRLFDHVLERYCPVTYIILSIVIKAWHICWGFFIILPIFVKVHFVCIAMFSTLALSLLGFILIVSIIEIIDETQLDAKIVTSWT